VISSLFISLVLSSQAAVMDPAQTHARAERLKPYSDDEWTRIAGQHIQERYEIDDGDTLSKISKRLFGDAKYWPKLWALNSDSIKNAHLIKAGYFITFMPGTNTSLPKLAVGDMPTPAEGHEPVAKKQPDHVEVASNDDAFVGPERSQEWKDLPHQRWEPVVYKKNLSVDPLGFDKNSRITFSKNRGVDLASITTSEKLIPVGEITGARTESTGLTISDLVFIQPQDHLQIGETYSVTLAEPTVLRSAKSSRYGYAYPNLGRVRILSVRDNVFVGKITHAAGAMNRGNILVPLIQRVKELTLIPAPQSIEATLMMDPSASTYVAAQYKQVFADRGASDGVRAGMVFRSYQYFDPQTDKRLTDADMMVEADFLVVQVSENFSSLLTLSGQGVIQEGTTMVLLTDVSSVLNAKELIEQSDSTQEINKEKSVDELDKLDHGEDVGRGEKKELKQLEEWKGNPAASDIKPAPGAEATPALPEPPAPPAVEAPAPPPAEAPAVPTPETAPVTPPAAEIPPAPPVEAPPAPPAEMPPPPPAEATPPPPPVEPPPTAAVTPGSPETAPLPPVQQNATPGATNGVDDPLYHEPPPLPPPPTSD